MVKTNLNRHVVRSMSIVTSSALAVMFFGLWGYYSVVDWLNPTAPDSDSWQLGDFLILGFIVLVALVTAAIVGWRLSARVVRPLHAVARAARAISEGDFAARAEESGRGYGEADELIHDFNGMAGRLQRAEEELRYSNSAIAHELRTPLTILRGRIQGLAEGLFEPNQSTYSGLLAHVDALSRLVDDLRVLALFNVGKLQLDLVAFDLAQEATIVVEMSEPELANAGVTVERKLDSAMVIADAARIRQAMLAVIDNARRYAGPCNIVIETCAEADRCLIRLTDFGPGFPDNAEKVFERFWRGEASRSRAGGGMGLGLSIVRAIARAHDGDALAYSSPGGGATIEIWLPKRAGG